MRTTYYYYQFMFNRGVIELMFLLQMIGWDKIMSNQY